MVVLGKSKIEDGMVFVKIFDYLFRLMKKGFEMEIVEKERKN